jgi:integrase
MRAASWTLNPNAIIDDARYEKILKACRELPARLALRIAGNMGWRVGEIVHISVQDVDLANHRIRKWVLKKRTGPTAGLGAETLKPISKVVEPELQKLVGKRTSGWLFPTMEGPIPRKKKRRAAPKCDVLVGKQKGRCSGGHVSKRTVQAWFERACKASRLPNVKGRGIHALRHTFAFRAAQKLKDPFKVRDLLDHADVSLAAVYVQSSNQKAALDEIES